MRLCPGLLHIGDSAGCDRHGDLGSGHGPEGHIRGCKPSLGLGGECADQGAPLPRVLQECSFAQFSSASSRHVYKPCAPVHAIGRTQSLILLVSAMI